MSGDHEFFPKTNLGRVRAAVCSYDFMDGEGGTYKTTFYKWKYVIYLLAVELYLISVERVLS